MNIVRRAWLNLYPHTPAGRRRAAEIQARAYTRTMTDGEVHATLLATHAHQPMHRAAAREAHSRSLPVVRRCVICEGEFRPIGNQLACKPCGVPFPHLS